MLVGCAEGRVFVRVVAVGRESSLLAGVPWCEFHGVEPGVALPVAGARGVRYVIAAFGSIRIRPLAFQACLPWLQVFD